ncbi:MAG TPA: type I methionyl aminopeptidase [Abditibacteriaceae bacterium]|nr:type I methionyl aminopeptidase [Abditibacteriaceae bacterium]
MAIVLKGKNELKLMRKSGRLAQHILNTLGRAAAAGITPRQLDTLAKRMLQSAGAKSPFLGYHGYPASINVSVNEAVVHGIPSDVPLTNGDIASLDVGTLLNGFIGDTAGTFAIGEVSPRAQRLMRITKEALYLGINEARAGNRVGDIGWAIQNHVESHGYTVVKALVGHGVGRTMHEDPQVPNHGQPGEGVKLKPGMTIAIEPMVNEGTDEVVQLDDKWTYVTADGLLSAHYEHTVAILSDGVEILTRDD